jgi:hypothetical protein
MKKIFYPNKIGLQMYKGKETYMATIAAHTSFTICGFMASFTSS